MFKNKYLIIDIYYLKKMVYNLQDIIKNQNSYLESLSENEDNFISFITLKNLKSEDIFELDGVLRIQYKNKDIIPLDCWDDIPTLLIYFLNALEECAVNKTAEFYFPDQPLNIKMELQDNYINLIFEGIENKIDKILFLEEFLGISKLFFELLVKKLNYKSYENELLQIENIKSIFNL